MSNRSCTIHQRKIGWLALCAVLLLIAMFIFDLRTVQAQDDVASPELTGSISGQVIDSESMEPLPNIDVTIYADRYGGYKATDVTDAGGRYRVENLPTGRYYVGFSGGDEPYVPLFFPFGEEIREGVGVPVNADDVTGIDVEMQLGGIITGTVTMQDGSIPPYAYLEVFRPDGDGRWGIIRYALFEAEPGADDLTYSISGLAEGPYRIGVRTYVDSIGYGEYFDDATWLDEATTITVTKGLLTPNINFVLGSGDNYGVLGGRITATEDGRPLPGIRVTTYISTTYGWSSRASLRTNGDGVYLGQGLISGYYTVCVQDERSIYASQCYDQAITLEGATPISVTASSAITDVNLAMQRNGVIEGQVRLTAPDASLSYVYGSVLAFVQDGGAYRVTGSASIYGNAADAFLFFTIKELRPNRYYLLAALYHQGNYYLEFYEDAVTLAAANDVTVTAGAITSQINFDLGENPDYGIMRGTVRSPAGAGLGQIRATAAISGTDSWATPQSATSAADGSYEIGHLLPGVYRLCFQDLRSLHFPECYEDAEPDSDAATPISVTVGARIDGIDAVLTPAAAISGTISATDDFVRDLNGLTLYKQSEDGYWLSEKYISLSSSQVLTLPYLLAPVESGVYRLGLSMGGYRSVKTIYYPNASSLDSAADIELAEGEHLNGIDFVLPDGADARIEGRVTYQGRPQSSIRVELISVEDYGRVLVHVFTDEQGEFVVNGLLPGAYYVHFVDPTAVLTPYYYGGSTPYDLGEVVILRTGTVARNVTMDLSGLTYTYYVTDQLYMPLISR